MIRRDVNLTATYPQTPAQVWEALTSAEALSAWLMPNDFQPRVGHRFQFRTKPAPGFDGNVNCEVLELVARERWKISWKGGGIDTTVTIELAPHGTGTQLRLKHDGFEGVRPLLISYILGRGWKGILVRLGRLLT